MCKYAVIIITFAAVVFYLPLRCFASSRNFVVNEEYDPIKVNWTSVVQSCNEAFAIEKRYANFFIRASAHDSLAINSKYGGADGSVLITKDEVGRPENKQDKFAYTLAPIAMNITNITGASVADVIAVCGAVAVEYLGGPNIFKINTSTLFYVGRKDSNVPNPHNEIAKGNIDTDGFAEFAKSKGLDLKEMVALMGSHILIDDHNCKNNDGTICDPTVERCDKLTMFTWSNLYYKDVCNAKTQIYLPATETIEWLTREDKKKIALCKYSSVKNQEAEVADVMMEEEQLNGYTSTFANVLEGCGSKCKPKPTWSYTINDAYLGKSCQNRKSKTDRMISDYMKEFAADTTSWNAVYAEAYKKMISLRAVWMNKIEIPL